jgi:hypothetical protein
MQIWITKGGIMAKTCCKCQDHILGLQNDPVYRAKHICPKKGE